MALTGTYANLLLEQDIDWLTIWFNRPESRNALSGELIAELRNVLDALAGDRRIRGVTLRGKGGVFCAGGDLKGFKRILQGGGSDETEVARFSREAGELFGQVESLPQVVVMLAEGAAMAGGFGLLCCADIVAVTEDARFALTETTLGIPPAQIAPYVAGRLGLARARRLILTAASFVGSEAESLGLADFVATDSGELTAFDDRVRQQVRRCAPGANAVTKEILLATRHLKPAAMVDFAAAGFAKCLLGAEGREGIAAFLEKRQPSWAEPAKESQA
jgi:isohexenylglutaconyl-CoA hydratase